MDESVDRLGGQEDRGLGGGTMGGDRGWAGGPGEVTGAGRVDQGMGPGLGRWIGGWDRGWAGGPGEVTGAGRGDQGR